MVERTNTLRRTQRAASTLPYARPSALKSANEPKKSGFFATVSNLFSSLWRSGNQVAIHATDDEETVERKPARPAEALVERGEDLLAAQPPLPQQNTNNIFQPPPQAQPQQSPPAASPPAASPPPPPPAAAFVPPPPELLRSKSLSSTPDDRSSKIDIVTNFLAQNTGRAINPMEARGMISLLQEIKEPDADKREPFRFATSERYNTPGPSTQVQRSSRPLTVNPNGNYVWRGAGSAKPKNRYKSSGFPPPRRPTVSMKLSPAKPKTDGKRRKIDDSLQESNADAGLSSLVSKVPQTNGPASASDPSKRPITPSASHSPERSPPPAAQSTTKLSSAGTAPASAVRLRTAGLQKPTTPANPSPLRQTWGQTDSPSPPAPPKPTHAANILFEIVQSTAPKPTPEYVNPFQAASPVPLPPRPARKPLVRRRSATAAANSKTNGEATQLTAESKKPEAELSPQKIIAATLPTGAKRSRPPPDLGKQREQTSAESALRRSARLRSPEPSAASTNGFARTATLKGDISTIEEVSDEDEPSPKKSKPNGIATSLQPAAVIMDHSTSISKDVADVEAATQTKPDVKTLRPSQIVEPSHTPPTTSSANPFAAALGPKSGHGVKSSAPKAPSKLRYSIQPEKDDSPKAPGKSLPTVSFGLPNSFPAAPVASTSTSAINLLAASTSAAPSVNKESTLNSTEEIKTFVALIPETTLPQYTFDFPQCSPGAGPSTEKAKAAAMAVPISSLPAFDFTVRASTNVSTSKSATTSVPAPSKGGFDWAAAGMKVPSKPADNWECSVCGLSNGPSAASKCGVCEADRPGASGSSAPVPTLPVSVPAPPTTGFNWGAAGLKAPTKSADSWDCSVCGLSNPPDATLKCNICEADKPGAAKSPVEPASAPVGPPTPPVAPSGGFNWAAAGMKAPTTTKGWKCSTCMLDNPDSAMKCTVCESPR